MIYMFLSNNPSSGDINSSNLPCLEIVSPPKPLAISALIFAGMHRSHDVVSARQRFV